MNQKVCSEAGREAFKEFRAALARFNDANTPVSIADRVMILSNAILLLDEYDRSIASGAAVQEPVAWVTEAAYPAPRYVSGNIDPSNIWGQRYTPLYAAPVPRQAEAVQPTQRYIVIGYGETDYPEAVFVNEREHLLDAVLGMMFTSPTDADDETREAFKKDLADDDEWCGNTWETTFEIGGIKIYDLGYGTAFESHAASTPATTAGAMDERAVRGQAPFANCRFKLCDLPGQCLGEGKCHHPAVAAASSSPAADSQGAAAAVPEGFALVPIKPDDAMQLAGAEAVRMDTTALNRIWTANAVFRAMVSAASSATPSTSAGEGE